MYAVIESLDDGKIAGVWLRPNKPEAFELARQLARESQMDLAAAEEQLQNHDCYIDGGSRVTVLAVTREAAWPEGVP